MIAVDFIRDLFTREPEHKGATDDWHPLTDLRRPVAAIAAAPHREVVDEHLGVLRIATQEPARFFDDDRYNALIGATK